MIKKEDIFHATEGGKSVIMHYYPQSSPCFGRSGAKNFKIRDDDRNPSCTVFNKDGVWFIQDKGGSDTKAYTAIQLVMKEEGLSFAQSIDWIAHKFAPSLCEDSRYSFSEKPRPDMQEVAPQDTMSVNVRPSGEFTEKEMQQLGYKITPEVCADLCLKPVDSYITARNAKGKSYRISSTENYPIYYYDYGTWGKLYQPLGDLRFLYVGGKPENVIFGEKDFLDAYEKAKNGVYPGKVAADPDDENSEMVDMTWQDLIICSGPSDALNVHCAGYHVCWLNSETAELSDYEFSLLTKLAKNIYILYDIDETGLANMYKIALRYLDIKIITLPAELSRFRTRGGKPCKDAKDFFVHFRRPENNNPHSLFKELVRLSGGLKFWQEKYTGQGHFSGYDINNVQLYSFLQASGFHKIATSTNKQGYTFCRVVDNVVTLIDEDAISAECSGYLLEYLRTHPQYYSQALANAIHRSKQLSKSSLSNLTMIEPNFNSYDADSDYFFFRNGIFRVSAAGVKEIKTSECPYMVYSSKIIDHDYKPGDMFFDIDYQPQYAALLNQLSTLSPSSPNYYTIRKQVDAIEDIYRYRLTVKSVGSSFMEYVYDTGRNYWRKEEAGYSLSDEERAEQDLNFISKCMSLGYMLSKHKNAGQPYAVYAMEMEQADEGEHLGGTGKSLFFNSIEQLRKQLYIDAQMVQDDKMQFLLQGVVKGVTDTVFMDDLNNKINLHRFMNMITGKMVVEVKHASSFVLPYSESPKIAFTSNHAIRNFDNSLNRRIWFAAFSDYYHSDSKQRGLIERSPFTKFGKNLIQDYDDKEMNDFYTFMFNCIMVWKKLRIRIQPPMKKIMQRTLQKSMSDDFLWWAEDYFSDDKLNTLVNRDKAFDDYRAILSKAAADMIKKQTFKRKLQDFCAYKDWRFNPDELLLSATEKARNDIRRKENGQDVYYFYIDTTHSDSLPVKLILDGPDPEGAGGDEPIFGE